MSSVVTRKFRTVALQLFLVCLREDACDETIRLRIKVSLFTCTPRDLEQLPPPSPSPGRPSFLALISDKSATYPGGQSNEKGAGM